jgi:phosphoglycolate phosphatase-like HAD superfamily hydrolase
MIRHIVWDWNGTLFDDQGVVVEATNASLRAIGIEHLVTNERYQELYRRPMEAFYADLVGFPVTATQWPVLDAAFFDYYNSHMRECGLNRDALAAMDTWSTDRAAPRTQSLLSMFGHDNLVRLTGEFELHPRFHRIDGRPDDQDFGPKAKYLVRHVEHLRSADPALTAEQIALIGDCADDADAAFHLGATAVLFTGGSSSRAVLAKSGAPVVDSLTEAVALLCAL